MRTSTGARPLAGHTGTEQGVARPVRAHPGANRRAPRRRAAGECHILPLSLRSTFCLASPYVRRQSLVLQEASQSHLAYCPRHPCRCDTSNRSLTPPPPPRYLPRACLPHTPSTHRTALAGARACGLGGVRAERRDGFAARRGAGGCGWCARPPRAKAARRALSGTWRTGAPRMSTPWFASALFRSKHPHPKP